VPDYPAPGQHLGFHWMTQAMAVVDGELRQVLERAKGVEAASIPAEMMAQLLGMGWLVEDGTDERADLAQWYRRNRQNGRALKVMVLTTYECNFACTYCVEEGVKQPVRLQEDKAAQIVRWIAARLEQQGAERLLLNFYGGEPLLNMAGLEQVAAPLRAYAQAHGLEFEGSVTTNGALLNRTTAERLARLGIQWAKVTLDGDRDAHDAKRPFRSGRGSFDLILRNLEEVWDLIEIRVTGNVDGQNLHAVPRLLDYLEAHGLGDKIGGLHFGPISGPACEGFTHRQGGLLQIQRVEAAEGDGFSSGLAGQILACNREVARRGLPARKVLGANLCMLNQDGSAVVIDPEGQIYKCPTMVGHESFVVGNVEQEGLHGDHLQLCAEDLAECLDCKWMPACGGGCRFLSFLGHGDIRRRHCTREYFQRHEVEMIQMDYEICVQEQ
jgi:uncharacterized protein